MSISDYLKKGQDVTFKIDKPDISPRFLSIVEEIVENRFTIKVLDDRFNIADQKPGSDAVVFGRKAGLEYSLKVKIGKIVNNLITLEYVPSRSHLRVNSYVILNYKVVTGEEFIEKRKRFIQNISRDTEDYLYAQRTFNPDDNDYGSEHTAADIINEIRNLHRKVDFIINHLVKTDSKNILDQEQTEVNLSGSGMKFSSKDDLKPGDFLDMKLVLPMSSGIVIELMAEVVRVVKPSETLRSDHPDAFEVGVKYVAINEDDREMIIRYTFKRQRELLRAFESYSA